MKNYLDKMVIKPDYVVKYNPNYEVKHAGNSTYDGEPNPSSDIMIDIPCMNYFKVEGYIASKKNPDAPLPAIIHTSKKMLNKNIDVYYYDPTVGKRIQYQDKHDLFIYKSAQNAILAGKEMALYDEADRYVEMYKDVADPIIGRIKGIINNPLYRRMGQGFIELLTQEFEKRKNDFEPTVNNAKEKAKDAYDKAKNTVKTGVDRLFDEIKNPNKEDVPFWCETEQCALYRELTEKYAVTLKHRKNLNGSKYSVTIFNLPLGSEKLYYITREMFHDIYAILESNDTAYNKELSGRLKFNSIMDILKDTVNTDINHNADKTPVKTKPIQIVNFRDEDKVESNNLFKRKFNIGDKVTVNDKVRVKYRAYLHQVGTVINISSSGNKTIYVISFSNGVSVAHVDLYSNELDNVPKKEYNEPKVNIQYVTPSANRIDDLTKKMDDHDKILGKILNVLEDLKKK